ncbi:MAG: DNA cytosine methyltransferase [Lachnospira eligens]
MVNGELIVDNFAGGGGASTGIEEATGFSVDIAINHDPKAIAMHKANHPNTKHYCEDVWQVDPVQACNGHPVGLAWFSPDCKHFSKAKGGKPKDKNIRGLAWVACRWAGLVRPRVIMLENVEEFKTWGPLNRGHHPIKTKQGKTFNKFVNQLQDLGYEVQFRELVAADYGAPTMRKRFFMVARCDKRPIIWPEPTHAPADNEAVKKGMLKPYVGAYTQIDFSRPCPSIFDTSEQIKEKYGIKAVRPLAPKTMERIARGLKKFVLDNPEPFIVQCNHGGDRRPLDTKKPLPTITSKHGYGIVEPYMVQIGQTGFTKDRSKNIQEPLSTIVSKNEHCLICPTLIQYHSETVHGEVRGQTIDNPVMTIDGSNRYGLVLSNLIQMNNHCDGRDIKKPLPTITAGDGHFGEVRAFLVKYYGDATGQDIKQPLDTITTKDRFGLVTIEGTDYQIVDIGLRMLEPRELYGCQGFPSDYIIDHDYTGKTYPRAEQVKEDYKQDQKQQYAGRMVEQFDRLSKYSLDSDNKKMYEVRKEQWENVSKEYERGYIDNNSQRIGTNKIDLDYINSKDYADKYMKISKDMELNNVIYSKSMDILRSNNSSDTEGLCVISVSNRQVLLNVRGKPDAIGVELNKKQMSIINKHKNDIIGIHNHPTNLLPNGSDFVAAGARGYQYGIVVTHDGRIYKYSVGDKPFLPYLLDNRIDKYCSKEYNLNIKEAYEKALNEFRKEYGISWQEIE